MIKAASPFGDDLRLGFFGAVKIQTGVLRTSPKTQKEFILFYIISMKLH